MGKARAVVERALAAIEAGEREHLAQLFAPDVRLTMPAVEVAGLGQLQTAIEAFYEAFPDLHHEIIDCIESEDAVALELRISGTHAGPLRSQSGELAATGRTIDYLAADLFRLERGKIASWRAYFDRLTFLNQLELAPPAAEAI